MVGLEGGAFLACTACWGMGLCAGALEGPVRQGLSGNPRADLTVIGKEPPDQVAWWWPQDTVVPILLGPNALRGNMGYQVMSP